MRTVKIVEDFDGYPDGKTRTEYRKGQEPTVPVAFAELIVAKGHAKEDAPSTAQAAGGAPKAAAKKD